MADSDTVLDTALFATVTQLFRHLSKPTAPLTDLLRDLAPLLLQQYITAHPDLTSHQCARQLLTDLTKQVADQTPVYAALLQELVAGQPVSALARTAVTRWGWSESTFYTRYREARELFCRHLLEAEQRCQQQAAAEEKPTAVARIAKDNTSEAGDPPFKGLHYFDVGDAPLFFGREALIDELVEHLAHHRFLAVVGASGSGKSSLVRAGLIPRLQQATAPEEAPVNTVFLLTPTATPLKALAVTLVNNSTAILDALRLCDALTQDVRTLDFYASQLLASQRGAAKTSARVLIVVDQFEELFTLCHDAEERHAFVANLMNAVASHGPTAVVITLRADFYAHCSAFAHLRKALETQQKYIGPMAEAELRRAITEPAQRNGWHFESGLVDLLLRDVGNEPAALPLLSHALLETWQRRDGRTLSLTGYMSSGRVQGAIAQTAEQVFYRQLTSEQQAIARTVFLRLTELGEGRPDTRRRTALAELTPTTHNTDQVTEALHILSAARLITLDEEVVEVAHEALIREWPRLRTWLLEEREALLTQRRIRDAALEWQRLQRDPSSLYRGLQLEQALAWAADHQAELNELERAFLDASLFEKQRTHAETTRQLLIARSGQLAALSQVVAQQRADRLSSLPMLLARAAVETTWQVDPAIIPTPFVTPEADAALQRALDQTPPWLMTLPRHRHGGRLIAIAFSPDGQYLVTTSSDETARIWQIATGAQVNLLEGHHHRVQFAGFSHDGTRLAMADAAGYVCLWDWRSSHELLRFQAHPGGASTAVFSPDGQTLVTTGDEPIVRLWRVDSGEPVAALSGHTADLLAATFSYGGQWLATGGDDQVVLIWDLATRRLLRRLTGHEHGVYAVAFSPDDHWLLTASWDKTVRLWDCTTGALRLVLPHPDPVLSACFSPDGLTIVTGCRDRQARLWDVTTGQVRQCLAGHQGRVRAVAYHPNGGAVATASDDATFRLWDVTNGNPLPWPGRHLDNVTALAFSPTNHLLATASLDCHVKLWRVADGYELASLPDQQPVKALQFSPDGALLVTAGADQPVRLWETKTYTLLQQLYGHPVPICALAVSPDATLLAAAGDDALIKLWEWRTGQQQIDLVGHTGAINLLAFSADGRALLSVSMDRTVRLWDVETGQVLFSVNLSVQQVRTAAYSDRTGMVATAGDELVVYLWESQTGREVGRLLGFERAIQSIAFSPDGQSILVGAQDGSVQLHNLTSSHQPLIIEGHTAAIQAVAFSHDGQRVATAGADQTVRLWATQTVKQARRLPHAAAITAVAFRPQGANLATATVEGVVVLWDIERRVERGRLLGHTAQIHSVQFHPGGLQLITASRDQTVRLWDIGAGAEIACLTRHTDWVKSAVFSSDGTLIATSGDDRKVWIWDAMTLQPLTCLQGFIDAVGSAVFSNDNQWLLTAANNKIAQTWSLATGEQLQHFAGHQGIVWSAALSPDNQLALTASADGTARLWDVQTGAEVHCLQGHGDEVYWAGFSPDGRQVATVSKDKSIGIWDVKSGVRQRWLVGHAGEVYCAAFAPTGSQLVSGGQEHDLLWWDVHLDVLLQKASRRIQRDPVAFTREERQRFRLMPEGEG